MSDQRKVVTAAPENSETPLERVRSWVTPNRLFFVRNHFPLPQIDLDAWRLRLQGCVRRSREWTWEDVAALPTRSVFATVECAGNGRSFLTPRAAGVQWGAGAIGHAEFSGVPLAHLLEEAGLRPEAVEVLCEGCDEGTEADHPRPMRFARSLPLAKALDPDTLLATHMNGEPLEPLHGFPLRLFVPGWYGVASVKWLTRIEVLDRPFSGYFQTTKYTVHRQTSRGLETVVVGPMAVKSEIIRPQAGSVLGLGANRIFGVAWAGEEAVAGVDISIDGGRTWNEALLLGPHAPYSWTLWEYLWEAAVPGHYTLLARARSADGRVQPLAHDPLNGGYLIHHARPLAIMIEAGRPAYVQPSNIEALVYDMNAFAEENTRLPLDVMIEFTAGAGI
jgi:DMSO/TMAO reductase YedYZ molybdopterin-dependent catalytic subunit